MAVKAEASDIHVGSGDVPALRVNGEIRRLPYPKISSEQAHRFADELMTDHQRSVFHRNLSVDFPFTLEGIARFRANIFVQARGVSMALRLIPSRVRSLREIGTPPIVEQISEMRNGLILVTGSTGSGKTTTLAAIVDQINSSRSDHVITIEDPIEYIHTPKQCLVSQREVGPHTPSFAAALRAALREDPDVILVGEMRDLETISLAITAAETGHMVLGTLHTNNCMETVDRIIDVYPSEKQKQIRIMLANSLQAVVSQTLARRASGEGRMAICEVMLVTPAIRNLIRENKSHQIPTLLDTNRSMGMQSMTVAIEKAAQRGFITSTEADLMKKRMRLNKKKGASR